MITFELPFYFMLISIGGESLAVAQNTYAVSWFKGAELNMVFGLQLSFSRVVSLFFFCFFLEIAMIMFKFALHILY